MSNVELWRIQLFGRWGSDVFLHYVQDTPLAQLQNLAQESSAQLSIQVAKQELSALILQAQSAKQTLAIPDQDMLQDCETAADLLPSPASASEFIQNTNGGGKLHRILDKDVSQHPRSWRTRCGWRFGRETTEHKCISAEEAKTFHSNKSVANVFLKPATSPPLPPPQAPRLPTRPIPHAHCVQEGEFGVGRNVKGHELCRPGWT